jgi:hypothetical protein
MTAASPPESKSPSRRALLAGALGGLGALAAGAIGRVSPVRATNGDVVTVGGSFTGTSVTRISTSTDGAMAMRGDATTYIGVFGTSTSGFEAVGVRGDSESGTGARGLSTSGAGMRGTSNSSNGVFGQSGSATASGVYGENNFKGYGVAGRSNAGLLVAGVGAAATLGDNTADGIGVWARSQHGIATYTHAVNSDALALKAQGVTQFSRSGKLTILGGHASVTKSSIRVDAGSLVLAVLQQDRSGIYARFGGARCGRRLVHHPPQQGGQQRHKGGVVHRELGRGEDRDVVT